MESPVLLAPRGPTPKIQKTPECMMTTHTVMSEPNVGLLSHQDPIMADGISRIVVPVQRGRASHLHGGRVRSTTPQTPVLRLSRKTMPLSCLQNQLQGPAQWAQTSTLINACGRRPHQGKKFRPALWVLGAEASPKDQIRIRRPCGPSRNQNPARRLPTRTAKRSERNLLLRSEEGQPLPQDCGNPSNVGANGFEIHAWPRRTTVWPFSEELLPQDLQGLLTYHGRDVLPPCKCLTALNRGVIILVCIIGYRPPARRCITSDRSTVLVCIALLIITQV